MYVTNSTNSVFERQKSCKSVLVLYLIYTYLNNKINRKLRYHFSTHIEDKNMMNLWNLCISSLLIVITIVAGSAVQQGSENPDVCPPGNAECNSKCDLNGTWRWYLLESHGYIMDTQYESFGKFMGEVDPLVMKEMMKNGDFVKIYSDDIQPNGEVWMKHGKSVRYSAENIENLKTIMAAGDIEQFLEALLDDYQTFSTEDEVRDLRNELILGAVDYTDMEAVLNWYVPKTPRLVAVWDPVIIIMRDGKRIKPPSYDIEGLHDVMDEGDIEAFITALLEDYASSNTYCDVKKLRNELFLGEVDYTDMNAVMQWYEQKVNTDLENDNVWIEEYLDEFWVNDGEKVKYSWENVACLHDAMSRMQEGGIEAFANVIVADYFSYTLEEDRVHLREILMRWIEDGSLNSTRSIMEWYEYYWMPKHILVSISLQFSLRS